MNSYLNLARNIVIVILVLHITTGGITSAEELPSNWQLPDEATALARALSITGVESFNRMATGVGAEVRQEIFVDTTTPFLSDSLNGRLVWRTVLMDAQLSKGSEKDLAASGKVRDLVVYQDAETGRLFRIESRLPTYDPSEWPKPSASSATSQMQIRSITYLGLPNSPPRLSFKQVLDSLHFSFVGAQEIIANLFIRSHLDTPARPVWVIRLYGIGTSISTRYPDMPKYATQYMCMELDATTGKNITAANNPKWRPKD